jgi:hypothetical protein
MEGAKAHRRIVVFEIVFIGVVVGALALGLVTRAALREAGLPDLHQPGLDG